MFTVVLPRSNDYVYICLFVNIKIKAVEYGKFGSLKLFDVSLDSSVGRVTTSSKSILFQYAQV